MNKGIANHMIEKREIEYEYKKKRSLSRYVIHIEFKITYARILKGATRQIKLSF